MGFCSFDYYLYLLLEYPFGVVPCFHIYMLPSSKQTKKLATHYCERYFSLPYSKNHPKKRDGAHKLKEPAD